jgi:nucleoside-diphosphate-sugar epimerase
VRIFVAGASSAIGRPLLRQLREHGHAVVGMTRSKPEAVRELGAEPVVADALDAAAVRLAVEQAKPDVVVNELTDLSAPMNPRKMDEWLAGTNRLRRDGTKHLAEAAAAVGAQKFISQSIAFAYTPEPGLKTEESPLVGAAGGDMGSAVAALEQTTLAAPGGIVLRYGFFYGPGTGYHRDGEQADRIRRRRMPVIGGGRGRFPFIHIDDAASATVAAIQHGAPGVYNIVDDEPAESREWIPYVAKILGAKKPWQVPLFVARVAAGPTARRATQLQPVSNAKAKMELKWHPRWASWREGFRAEFG